VYWRQPADSPGSWSQAYHSPFKLQNGEGEITIFATGDRLEGIASHLKSLHGDALVWVPGEVMAWGMAMEDGHLYRYLVQPRPPEEGGFWIMAYAQTVREAGKPGQQPDRHQLKQFPSLPQSTPTFYSFDEGNKLTVEISTTRSQPDAALNQLSEMLTSDGWQPSPLNTGGFQMFVKRDQVAFLGANIGKDGQTRVLRLHKPLGVK
jgi:hypothetical protein